eukprot:scaffold20268_cov111-Isochrysis_galbana.AAC.6
MASIARLPSPEPPKLPAAAPSAPEPVTEPSPAACHRCVLPGTRCHSTAAVEARSPAPLCASRRPSRLIAPFRSRKLQNRTKHALKGNGKTAHCCGHVRGAQGDRQARLRQGRV